MFRCAPGQRERERERERERVRQRAVILPIARGTGTRTHIFRCNAQEEKTAYVCVFGCKRARGREMERGKRERGTRG